MTEFYKVVTDEIIVGFGTKGSDDVTAITESEYNALCEMFSNRPSAPDGFTYVLHDAPREWVLIKLPPESDYDIDDAEALGILLGGTT